MQRALVKHLVLTAINAGDKASAFSAFRSHWPKDHLGKKLTNDELGQLLMAFIAKHPHLEDCLCADQGIRLMYVDSRIAARVIQQMTAVTVPVLCVHDGFIINYRHSRVLKGAMRAASKEVVGGDLAVSASGMGLDEMRDKPLHVIQDFITWRQTPRCAGYLARLEPMRLL